ncbi:MAG: thrombospondin type 3 repeat-containing protein [Planctomycetes bacterium]|nr:thrombospondin type 3 repeat-containing protein [Planctomycetota bacterium]
MNPCTDDVCADGVCVSTPNNRLCSDGNGCTHDVCTNGECVSTPHGGNCNDLNQCTIDDRCTDGTCLGTVITGPSCNDGNSCTSDDVCTHGVCRGSAIPGECPIFRVWVREVYDADLVPKCGATCPTQNLPEGIAVPGDFVDIEFTVEGWASITPVGRHAVVFQCTLDGATFSLGHARPGFRVADFPCSTHEDCLCTYTSIQGEFNDCADFTAISPAFCTCAGATCNAGAQTCSIEASVYIDRGRSDFLFQPVVNVSVVATLPVPLLKWAALDIGSFGVPEFDPGLQRVPPYYMGTLLVQVEDVVAGTYVIDLVQDENQTFLSKLPDGIFPFPAVVPLTITLGDFEGDDDDDGVPNAGDNCLLIPNPSQTDQDGDGVGNVCDNCPAVANVDQTDTDGDGVGDACEGACCLDDGACLAQDVETCLSAGGTPGPEGADCEGDADGDGIVDACDLCRGIDDAVFAPECEGAIPTTSQWGLIVLTLLLLAGGKIYFSGRRSVPSAT